MLVAAVLEYDAGSTELAVDRFDKLADLQPDNEMAARLLARALLADGDASELVARFAARASRPDASPYLLTLVGRAYEQLDRRDLAAPFLDRAAQASAAAVAALAPSDTGELAIYRWGDDPTAADVAVPTLRKLVSEGRAGEAAAYSLKLRGRFPNSSDIEVLTGDAAFLGGDTTGALALYRSAKRVRWTGALAQRIAAAEARLGHGDIAAAELSAYLAEHPQDGAVAALVGRDAAARGDWPQAATLLGHAARLPGGAGDARLIADLADAQLHLGDRERALGNAERAYALQRMSPRVTAVLAAALDAGGKQPNRPRILLAKAGALGGEPALALR